MAVDLRIPVSPIVGMVTTAGDATHPPTIILANPGAKTLRIYELMVSGEALTNRVRMRRVVTASGMTTGGTSTVGNLIRKDETDATTFAATLTGYTAATGLFAESAAFWYDKVVAAGSAGYLLQPIIRPQSFPLIVKPSSQIEFASQDNGTGVLLHFFVSFDEV